MGVHPQVQDACNSSMCVETSSFLVERNLIGSSWKYEGCGRLSSGQDPLQTFHCLRLNKLQRTTCKVAGRGRDVGLVDWEKVGEMARRREEGVVDVP
jgi:hypothetical protein